MLMLLNARPSRPSAVSDWNSDEIVLASSTAWPVTVVPPTVTVSVPTTPLADEPSPYDMDHVAPDSVLYVLLLDEV